MFHPDTSPIVAALSNDAMNERMQGLLADPDPVPLLISERTITEISSAMAIKLKVGQIRPEQCAAALAMFNKLIAENFTILPVIGRDFRVAMKFVDRHTLRIRADDALRLAAASARGVVVYIPDQRLAEAGPPLGVPTKLLA